jgi:aspartyl-tRNA(Asn)/glutamyl-tRNA(Gln) amidotransferase subunit A
MGGAAPPEILTAMPLDPYTTLATLSAEIAGGGLSPVALTEACLDRIGKLDGKHQAFVTVYDADARLAAEAAEKAIRSGHRIGAFHGIPIGLKDIIDLEGRVTTGGSAAWRDRVSPVTATLARQLIGQGMIVIGKTSTVEFAMGGWGTNTHMGTPWNPWDPTVHRTPGGSSSGSGVAVATGMVPAAIGTDTGGSIRHPASWNGIVGLKVTVGRISTHGVLPLSETLDTPGPMARSVEDAALLFRVLQGYDPEDPRTGWVLPADPMAGLKAGVGGLRLGVLESADREGVDAEVLGAYDAALEALAQLGARLIRVTLPIRFRDAAELTTAVIAPEAYRWVGDLADDDRQPIDPHVRPRILLGQNYSARDYLKTLDTRAALKKRFAAATADIDALLTPTTATPAIPIDAVDQKGLPALFTRLGNLLDLCALALPDGFTKAGLPTSLQIVCRGYDESSALRIGWAYEQATEWHRRRPPIDG